MGEQIKSKSLSARVLSLFLLNLSVAIVIGLIFWWFSGANPKMIGHFFVDSFVHTNVYGFAFGLSMSYLGERLAIIRPPWNWLSIGMSILIIAAPASALVELCLLALGNLQPDRFLREFLLKFSVVMIIGLIITFSVGIYDSFQNQIRSTTLKLRTQELEKERALKLATEARLASLESRLHPHFLFNTLNSISALISEDPAQAEQMVQRLSSLLRKSLDAFSQSKVTLSEEIKLVTDYLEIEKVRFRERLSYSIEIQPGLGSFELPPLTLQPLVENCIKHSISIRPNGGEIKISATLNHDRLTLSVWDDGPEFTKESAPVGHGLYSLQARLSAIVGEDATLDVQNPGIGKIVTISLPITACKVA